MRIIVIGSEGFIGSHLCAHFLKTGNEVYGADITEAPANTKYRYIKVSRLSNETEELFRAKAFDCCINAAGSGNVSYSVSHPLIDFEANTLDVIRILDAIRKVNPGCKYLHISSAAVYGNPTSLPIHESAPLSPISPYGFHKMMSEMICKEYSSLFGVPVAIIRPFSVFGTGLRKQLFWDICCKLKKEQGIELFGTGEETRDFIHITDFVLLAEHIIKESDFNGEVFNAAGGKEISIKAIAEIFEQYHSDKIKISFSGATKKGDPINWKADISALKKTGFSATADFKEEVIAYINWFNREYEG
ncbi:MAG: SDR family oxidoreductase [Ferruginibacter sp.]